MTDQAVAKTPSQATQSAPRLYYLDALRVIAILIVFLFHAVHPFDQADWHVKNIEQSLTLTVIMTILSMWGMPFFFLIAGAGSWFALRRRTAKQYAVERTRRLLVPYIFAALLVFFITQYFEWDNRIFLGKVDLTFPQYLQATWEWHLSLGFSPKWWGLGAHLWFLGFLYSFAILTLPLFQWFKGQNGQRTLDWIVRVCEKRGGLLLFLLPLLLIRYLLTPLFPIEYSWSDFILLMTFFIIGFILFANERILRAVRRDGWLLGGIGLAAVLFLLVLFMLGYPVEIWFESYGTLGFYLTMGVFTLVGLVWSVFMLFIGMRYMDVDKPWLRYAQEIALPFFIVHQPVILVIASFVVKWNAGIPLKMLVVVPSSFLVSWGLVEYVIRRVGFLRFLFGMTSGKPAGKQEAQVKPVHVG